MGIYLNPGNKAFSDIIKDKIYVDKSNLIKYTNEVFDTGRKFVCVSRPRRLGKSTDAQMLVAYYDESAKKEELCFTSIYDWNSSDISNGFFYPIN